MQRNIERNASPVPPHSCCLSCWVRPSLFFAQDSRIRSLLCLHETELHVQLNSFIYFSNLALCFSLTRWNFPVDTGLTRAGNINPTYSVQYPVLVIICNYAHFTEIHSSLKARQLKSPKSNFLVPRSNSCFFNNLPVLFSFQLAIKRDLYITKLISGWLQHCLKAYICPKQPGWIDFVCSGSLF